MESKANKERHGKSNVVDHKGHKASLLPCAAGRNVSSRLVFNCGLALAFVA